MDAETLIKEMDVAIGNMDTFIEQLAPYGVTDRLANCLLQLNAEWDEFLDVLGNNKR